MATKKGSSQVTQDQVSRAIAKYLSKGGRIVKLPEQKSYLSSRVGARWDSGVIDLQSPQ